MMNDQDFDFSDIDQQDTKHKKESTKQIALNKNRQKFFQYFSKKNVTNHKNNDNNNDFFFDQIADEQQADTKKKGSNNPSGQSQKQNTKTMKRQNAQIDKERIKNKKDTQQFDFAVAYNASNISTGNNNTAGNNNKNVGKIIQKSLNNIQKDQKYLLGQHKGKNKKAKNKYENQFFEEDAGKNNAVSKSKEVEDQDQDSASKILDLENLENQYEEEEYQEYKEQVKKQQSVSPSPSTKDKKKQTQVQNKQQQKTNKGKLLQMLAKAEDKVNVVSNQHNPKAPLSSATSKQSTTKRSNNPYHHKYQEQVQKAFPSTSQTEQKIKKLSQDRLNNLNDKMREMIKGFSNELTRMIDKNLTLLRNDSKQDSGPVVNVLENQVNVLQEIKKNNIKQLQITSNQLESVQKLQQKMRDSVEKHLRMSQEIESYQNRIFEISKDISSLKNTIGKDSKKATKIPKNNDSAVFDDRNAKSPSKKGRSVLQIREAHTNAQMTFDKNSRKLQQLQDKLYNLDSNLNETAEKKAQLLEKAHKQGVLFYSKQSKTKYEELKKRRSQLATFRSKFNSAIDAKAALIQHQSSDTQALVYDMQARFDRIQQQIQNSRNTMMSEIKKGKSNPKLSDNIKEVLSQLESYMQSERSKVNEKQQNSLDLISDNIYKRQYHRSANKKHQIEDPNKSRIEYKNYLAEIANTQKLAKAKKAGNQKSSAANHYQNNKANPFKRSITPGENPPRYVQQIQRKQAQTGKQIERLWKNPMEQKEKNVIMNKPRNPLKKQTAAHSMHVRSTAKDENEETSLYQKNTTLPINNPSTNKPTIRSANNSQSSASSSAAISQQINQTKQPQPQTNVLNSSPFRNIKLKKNNPSHQFGKSIQQSSSSLVNKSINQQQQLQKINNVAIAIADDDKNQQRQQQIQQQQQQQQQQVIKNNEVPAVLYKPKRFLNNNNLKRNVDSGYHPTSEQSSSLNKIQLQQSDGKGNNQTQTNIKKQTQQYDPFKKLILQGNKDGGSLAQNQNSKHMAQGAVINEENKGKKHFVLSRVSNRSSGLLNKSIKQTNTLDRTEPPVQNSRNPYLSKSPENDSNKQISSKQNLHAGVGRTRKFKPSLLQQQGIDRSSKQGNDIFSNVDDMTAVDRIGQARQSSLGKDKSVYNPSAIDNSEPNLNELLGINKMKKKVDALEDEGMIPSAKPVRKNPFQSKKKNDDFFDGLDF